MHFGYERQWLKNFGTGTSWKGGPGSSVGIATGYGLDGPGERIPVGPRFSALVQTGPGAHPASCTMGTGSFQGVKWPGRDADPSPLLVPRSNLKGRKQKGTGESCVMRSFIIYIPVQILEKHG
jgi:hypothetical protein